MQRQAKLRIWDFLAPAIMGIFVSVKVVYVALVELSNVTVLELIIVPNVSGGAARASLKSLRLS